MSSDQTTGQDVVRSAEDAVERAKDVFIMLS
jgi:hypothetical protein